VVRPFRYRTYGSTRASRLQPQDPIGFRMHASLFLLIALPLFIIANKSLGDWKIAQWQRIAARITLFFVAFFIIYPVLAFTTESRLATFAIIELFRLALLLSIVGRESKILEANLSFLFAEVAFMVFMATLFMNIGGDDAYLDNSLYFFVYEFLLAVLSSLAHKLYSYKSTWMNAVYSFLALAFLRWAGDRELSGAGALSDIGLEERMLVLVSILSLMLVFGTFSSVNRGR